MVERHMYIHTCTLGRLRIGIYEIRELVLVPYTCRNRKEGCARRDARAMVAYVQLKVIALTVDRRQDCLCLCYL